MPGSSNNTSSFIPKRGPVRRRKPKSKNQIFLFTIITYSLLFASLLAAGGTYFYKNYLTSQLQEEVTELDLAIATFSTEDLARVREFDVTLRRATDRIDNNASIVAILDGLDVATVEPVQLQSMSIERAADSEFLLTGTVQTSSFDAAMFQRKVYNANRRLFSAVEVNEVSVTNDYSDDEGQTTDDDNTSVRKQEVTFSVALSVPLEEVLFDPEKARMTDDVDDEVVFLSATTTEEIIGIDETSI